MTKCLNYIDQKQALKWFSYDPGTGLITWIKKPPRGHVKCGDVAGSRTPDGYIVVGFQGKPLKAHRLAWLMQNGKWPDGEIDHINGNPSDNRILNLRDATSMLNQQNKRRCNKNNTGSGILGVYPSKNRWQAKIEHAGVQHYLGTFKTKDDARAAYLSVKRTLHAGCMI